MIEPREKQEPAAVSRNYDALDPFYREIWGCDLHHGYWKNGRETVAEAVENLTAAVADLARISPGDHVCDVGCGYGGTSLWLAGHRGAEVTGFTVSGHQAGMAASAAGQLAASVPQPRFLCRDWLENRLPPTPPTRSCRSNVFPTWATRLRFSGRSPVCSSLVAVSG